MRAAALTTVIAAAALVVTACTSNQTGQASSPSGGQTAAPSTSTAGTVTNGLTGLNACSLLTDAEAQQAVPGAGTHQDMGAIGGSGVSSCGWTKPATNDSAAQSFGITVRPAQGIKDIVVSPGGQLSNTTTTTGRQAVLLKNNEGKGSCAASIAVGSGRVDINDATNGANATTDAACAIVSKIDDYVEKRLPAS
ncbi:DUF3558 family protein [Amycolatopsis pigmentata]|uniref:DUF3558 family protein n=1 Tax=Amycolatopsis pigmentata TaxID=450801 RepID=A0ABW5G5I2_9PSEU